jgi:hypothetical protein
MSENEQNKTDNIFRKKFEEMLFKPPKANLDELRANVLQASLQDKVTQNKMLKGSLAVISLLLGGCIYALWNNQDTPITNKMTEKLTRIYVRDTIYITKYENKYIKTPIYIYPKENIDKKLYASNQKQLNESNENELAKNFQNNDIEGNLMPRNTSSIEKGILQNSNDFKSLGGSKQGNSDGNTLGKAFENGKVELNNYEQLKINFEYLKAKQNESNIAWNLPKVKVKPKNIPAGKPLRDKMPFLDRLSLGLNGGFEANKADVRIQAIEAFGLGDEEINNTSNVGVRVGMQLSKKVSILSGLEYQKINFEHEGAHKEQITAVKGADGNPLFLRHTVFGIAELPLNKMTASPKVGSFVNVEGEEGHFITAFNIPLLLKYQFYEKVYSTHHNFSGIKFYGIGGVKFAIPYRQKLEIEVYEPNGNDFYLQLTHFKNVNRYSAINLGLGIEYKFNKKTQVYFEPYYQSSLNSLVNIMPVKTFIKGVGIKFGVNYSFTKK